MQAPDPAYSYLDRGYQALKASDLDVAVAAFQEAAKLAPDRVVIHKELANTYIKMGETEKAVEELETARRLAPTDYENALSLAYLYFEVQKDDLGIGLLELIAAQSTNAETRQQAAQTLAQERRFYRAQIERWRKAVEQDPRNAAARQELGSLYQKDRDYRRAIEQYEAKQRLERDDAVWLILARLYDSLGEPAPARALYLLAWRSDDPRTSELGRAGLSNAYPAPADFQRALEFDPKNLKVQRDLAYLYLNIHDPAAATAEFEKITARVPQDWQSVLQLAFLYLDAGAADKARPLLDRVMKQAPPELARRASEALLKLGGESSPKERSRLEQISRGYAALAANRFAAAAEFFESAYYMRPEEDAVALQLGWIHNMLHQDEQAIRWFRLAGRSADARVASEAQRAARNLEPELRKVGYSLWTNPVISSRWQDMFGYAQAKAELKTHGRLKPYLSLRFNGDMRTRSQAVAPLFFSDGGWTLGLGLFARIRKDVSLWAEAGEMLSYYARPVPGTGRFYPDYRAGATWFRASGPTLFTDVPGYHRFADAAVASIFISRYSKDFFNYVQTRAGYHLPRKGMLNSQAYLAVNYVKDTKNLYWANFAELGPGVTFGFRNFPQMQTSVGLMRGVYLVNQDNPRRPNFLDLRVNIWFARSF